MVLRFLKSSWRTLVIIISPAVLSPLAFPGSSKESRCAYGLLLMCVYWITEALPLPVTAMLPVLVFPVLGVAPSKDMSKHYIKDVDFLLIGGLIMAIAIEKSNIHKRFALRLLMICGVSPKRLLLAFMLGTAFMSMWISNTAATSMMLPIARGLLDRLFTLERLVKCTHDNDREALMTKPNHSNDSSSNQKKIHSECIEIELQTNHRLADGNSGITFISWMVFCAPLALLALGFVWLWLQIVFLGPRETFGCCQQHDTRFRADEEIANLVRKEHKKLGSPSFSECVVFLHMVLMVLLWLMRKPGLFPGYADLFNKGYISDAVPSVLVVLSLFIFPAKWPSYLHCKNKGQACTGVRETPSVIQWSDVNSNLPWGIILLLGGGFALGEACQISGLSKVIAAKLSIIESLGPEVACLVVVIITCIVTEVTSNTVIVTLFMPILGELALSMKIHPLYFMLSAGISSNFAYMLPVATPPNAVVFAYGDVKVIDMAKAGFVLNIFNIILVTMAINTWGTAYFGLNEFPDWAERSRLASNSVVSNFTQNVHSMFDTSTAGQL